MPIDANFIGGAAQSFSRQQQIQSQRAMQKAQFDLQKKRFDLEDRLGSLKTQTRAEVEAVAARFIAGGYEVKIGG